MVAVPAMILPAPDEFRAMQPVGSSTHSDGMAAPGLLPVRMTADALVVSPNWFTTPPKRLVRGLDTVTFKRRQGGAARAPGLGADGEVWGAVWGAGEGKGAFY